MTKLLIAVIVLVLAGCIPGCAGIPESTLNSLATAGGGCAKSTGMWGSLLVMVAGADKGSLRNGEATVSGDCGGITIKDAASVRAVPPVPGTVTTITVPPTPGTTTTTVTPTR